MSNRLLSYKPLDTDLAALLLRFLLGGLMLYHGIQKIVNYDLYLSMFTDILGIGSRLSYNLMIFAEFFCSLLVIIGMYTRLAVLPIMFEMAVAFFIAHKHDKFQVKELACLFMLLCIPVFILGSGKFSIDWLIRKRKPS